MTILDRARSARRIRIDPDRYADELARSLQNVDAANPPARGRSGTAGAVHDATDAARESLDRAAGLARSLGHDLAKAGGELNLEGRLDEVGQRIRATASAAALRAVIARLERDLPEMDRDRYSRAYHRGRAQARSKYLVVGVVAGATAGVIAALLLDPRHGMERRERITRRASSLTQGLQRQASAKAKGVSSRARGMAGERGLVKSGESAAPETETEAAAGMVEAAAVEMVPPVEIAPAEAAVPEASEASIADPTPAAPEQIG